MLFEIFEYEFMRRAFVAGSLVGMILPLIGVFLVMRRASMLSDTIAHGALAGAGLGIFLGLPVAPFIVLFCLLSAVGIEVLSIRKKFFPEALQALFLSGGVALALIFNHFAADASANLESYLFGSIIAVSTVDLLVLLAVSALVVAVFFACWWQFLALSFDEDHAAAMGLNAAWINVMIAVLAALMIALSLRIIGGLLIGALLIIPVLCAMRLTTSFRKTALAASLIGLCSVICGLFLSFYYDLPGASAIVLVNILIFLIIHSGVGLRRFGRSA